MRKEEIAQIDSERKHLESLYQERINFYLVFASVFVVGLSEIGDANVKVVALWVMAIVSTVITLSVIRTFRLVMKALAEIKADEHHPYTRYHDAIAIPPDANKFLVSVPVILTVFFWWAASHYSNWHWLWHWLLSHVTGPTYPGVK